MRLVPAVLVTALLWLVPNLAFAQNKVALQKGVTVGTAKVFANLAVFPIFASVQENLGEFTTLSSALKKKQAEVSELKDGARVNELVIKNKSKTKILVLAGTVVKGGKQDRQVAQDFVISANQTKNIEAFCVEQGRWNGSRQGKATGGKFKALDVMASSGVRYAGQYKGNQQKVWDEVSKVNKKNSKKTSTSTLTATLDAPDVKRERNKLAGEVNAFLVSQPSSKLVGFAYAVDGKVRNVRWFMNHQVFGMFQQPLVNTAVVEALTARAAAKAAGKKVRTVQMRPTAIAKFVKKLAAAKVKTKTSGRNAYEYRFSGKGAASKTMYKPKPSAPPKAVSEDYSAE